MKVIKTLSIDSEVWGACMASGINASAIANEALRLASMIGADGKDGEMSDALKQRADLEKDMACLRRIHDKNFERFNEGAKIFCEKWGVSLADAVAIGEGKQKRVSPAPPSQK
jgi:hypothetical protein